MVAPILGALAGNVLRQFRVEIDYAVGVVYFERAEDAEPHDLDMVGLIFASTAHNSLVVSGISSEADQVVRNQVKVGDRLLRVDGVAVSSFSLMQIVDRLRGKPRDEKKLELEHEGKPYQIQARVTRIM
jgi:C-terminal processing protease CtpA/Prc